MKNVSDSEISVSMEYNSMLHQKLLYGKIAT